MLVAVDLVPQTLDPRLRCGPEVLERDDVAHLPLGLLAQLLAQGALVNGAGQGAAHLVDAGLLGQPLRVQGVVEGM